MAEHLALVGLMGAGKTTVGRVLAERLGRAFVDTDEMVEQAEGASVAEIIGSSGEAAFRAAERRALAAALGRPESSVVSVGGGAVVHPQSRGLLRSSCVVLWLRAPCEVLAERVGPGEGRPLLSGSPLGSLCRLEEQRRLLYSEVAHIALDTADLTPAAVAGRALALLERFARPGKLATVPVRLAGRSYDVIVGPGARHKLAEMLPGQARRAAIVTQERVGWGVDVGVEGRSFVIREGEEAKSLSTVESLCRGFAKWGLTRSDVVVGLGGGVVTDLAGFVAACWHRGVPVVHAPTTLLGQVDAAIGGKCGVNLPEGKNLVGAFWQPEAVVCDTELLSSLPEAEWRSGMGEVAKYAFLGGEGIEKLPVDEQVAACVAIKAAIVESDEREAGRRALLNYGHTLAHALEAAGWGGGPGEGAPGATGLRHGEAVGVGLVFAARLARRLGRIGAERVAEHERVVSACGLSTDIPEGMDAARVVELMARDKKARGDLTFVLDGPSGLELVHDVPRAEVLATLVEMGAR